jgi:hypothetical protein
MPADKKWYTQMIAGPYLMKDKEAGLLGRNAPEHGQETANSNLDVRPKREAL